MEIIITPKHECSIAKTKYNCDYVISIQDANDNETELPKRVSMGHHRHFFFDDIAEPNGIRPSNRDGTMRDCPPDIDDIKGILNFAKIVPDNGRMLVHCFAGVSRSAAAAYIIYCQEMGEGKEVEAMEKTERSAVYGGIWPNKLVARYADEVLNRNGAVIKALDDWKEIRNPKLKRMGI